MQRPIANAADRKFLTSQLPEEFTVSFVKAKHDAAITFVVFTVFRTIVRAYENFSISDDRVSVSLRAQLSRPCNVNVFFQVEIETNSGRLADHIATRRTAPQRPVASNHRIFGLHVRCLSGTWLGDLLPRYRVQAD